METIYDWITIIIFAGLVVVFLQRSVGPRPDNDRVINYLPPSVGCMGANYFGNHEMPVMAVLLIAATLAYIWYVIRPLQRIG